jgi:hypothetical protein
MGGDRDRRLLKRDELLAEISDRQKIIHSLVGINDVELNIVPLG